MYILSGARVGGVIDFAQAVADEVVAAGGSAIAIAGSVGNPDDVKATVEAAVGALAGARACYKAVLASPNATETERGAAGRGLQDPP